MRKFFLGMTALTLALAIVGCGDTGSDTTATVAGNGEYENEILTTTPVDQDKTLVTVRVENNVAQSVDLESILEEQFPDVDFVLVHDGSINSEYNIRADLVNGTECDIIMSRRLNLVDDIAGDYLLDLSNESFVDSYFMTAIDSCANSDGNLYYLPGPSDVYGIVYDKTMFDENGWTLPGSYSEFVELINTIKEADLTSTYTDADGNVQEETVVPIQPTMMYPDMFQIFFNTYGFNDVYAGGENYVWLSEYQNGTGSMVGHMEPAVEKFKGLFDDGILSLADWDVQPSTRSSMMYTYHTTAMIVENQNAINYNESFATDVLHEVAMMPFWTSDEADSDYVYAIPNYFIAINKSAAAVSEEKKELLISVLDFLSSIEGQEELLNDSPQISNVQGVSMDNSSFSEGILNTVERGQVISNFFLATNENSKQVEKQLRSTTPDMINGDMSVEDWLLAADQVRDDFIAGNLTQEEVYGTVDTTLTRLESAYTMAEMYRELTDADVGLCLGGAWRYGTDGYFYEGDITDSSLSCVAPDKETSSDENPMANTIVSATMTGQQIIDILNDASGPEDSSEGTGYYYVAAGLTVEFAPWEAEGSRVISVKTPDGKDLDPEASYKVGFFYGSLPAKSQAPEESLGETWLESFLGWLDEQGGEIKKPDMTLTLKY